MPGKVVTIMNMKGGVGKTTVCANLGGYLGTYEVRNRRRQILLIDYDPQFNLSQMVLKTKAYFQAEKENKTAFAILAKDSAARDPFEIPLSTEDAPPEISDVTCRVSSRIDIVPSTIDLMYMALGAGDDAAAHADNRFRAFINTARKKYDVIFIDCHPAGSLLTRTALSNSEHVLIPVAPNNFSARGVALMDKFIKSSTPAGAAATPHILFNRTSRGKPAKDELILRSNPRYAKLCIGSSLQKYKAFSDPQEGKNFVWRSKAPYSTLAFRNLVAVANDICTRLKI